MPPPPRPTLREAASSRWSATFRLLCAAASGLLLAGAFPAYDHWWLAFPAVALLSVAVTGTQWRFAALLGLVSGLAFFLPTLSWSGIYVGNLPWIALATLESLYIAAMCAGTAALQRPFLSGPLRPLVYAVVPVMWVLQETARGSTPFGGFPWARLAFSQADSPLAHLAAFAGAPGVTFGVAAVGALVHALGRLVSTAVRRPGEWGMLGQGAHPGLAAALALCAVAPAIAALALEPPTDGRRVSMLFVQGNVPKPGLDFNSERRKVLDNHVQMTLSRQSELSADPPSLVVWPENSSDIDPLRNPDADAAIRSAVDGIGAPVLVGAVLREPSPRVSNASMLYRPGVETPERYVKQHPVPFAEYMPYRSFFRSLSDKVDLLTTDFAAGHRPGAFEIDTDAGRPYWAIPTICFEVAYDDLMREAAMQPGMRENVLVVQTNNATFGFTDESEQQFAISRIRAIEHGRSVVHVSTVGVSAFIAPDGTYEDKTALFTSAAEIGSPVVRSEVTVSDRIGRLPEAAAGVLALLLAAGGHWQRRRTARVKAHSHQEEEPAVV